MEKIAFIINPKSGTRKKRRILSLIPKIFHPDRFYVGVYTTRYAGHAEELARELASFFDVVVAVGGDGTVNEVACGLVGTGCMMGILPSGSGNGFARHIGIFGTRLHAMRRIRDGRPTPVDLIYVNGRPSINLSGIGFDALVAHEFAKSVRRGFSPYVRQTFRAFFHFYPFDVTIECDGQTRRERVLMVAFANSAQFGFNAVLCPFSQVNDGKMELCFLRPFPFLAAPVMALRLFAKTMDRCRYIDYLQTSKAVITSKVPVPSHIDGTPFDTSQRYEVEVKEHSIVIIC